MYANLEGVARVVFKGKSRGKKRRRAVVKKLVREGQVHLAHQALVDRVLFKQSRGRLRFPTWAELYNLLGLTGHVCYLRD